MNKYCGAADPQRNNILTTSHIGNVIMKLLLLYIRFKAANPQREASRTKIFNFANGLLEIYFVCTYFREWCSGVVFWMEQMGYLKYILCVLIFESGVVV